MLAHWFERGLGQIVAPDEQAAARQEEEEGGGASSSLWQLVAPDPVYEASRHGDKHDRKTPKAPPNHAFLSPPTTDTIVRCEHCHEWTPVKNQEQAFSTPQSSNKRELSDLDGLVLQAAKETAASMTSPKAVTELRNKIFTLCANSKPLKEKARNRLKKLVEMEPSLLQCRSSNLGNLVADGFTPLIAAAAVNNVAAIEILLDTSHFQSLLQDRDLQGRTALHVAAEMGHVQAVECLHKYYGEEVAPVDLTGHTPLGRAVTSTKPSAVKNQLVLEQELFSPGDVSVCGHKTPAKDRCRDISKLFLSCGFADMPGLRVAMEDAVCMEFWSDDSAKALLGVCDGHGDDGLTSQFVAHSSARVLRETDEYPQHDFSTALRTACLRVDEELKQSKANCGGGTTAVLALVTTGAIVVANVGDSRCILIQSREDSSSLGVSALEETMADLALVDESKTSAEPSPKQDATEKDGTTEPPESEPEVSKEKITLTEPNHGNIVVTALSEDHKPNLDVEKNRIEKAGLSVVAETFEENNEEVTIWKVMRSENERMAVSRSFGDYEYKSNPNLTAQEQAVVALPDVRVHTRNADRDMYLVLACDGVWDVMSNEEVANFIVTSVEDLSQEGFSAEEVLPQAGDLLLNKCLEKGSRDNMTVVVVALDKAVKQISGGHVVGRALNFSQE